MKIKIKSATSFRAIGAQLRKRMRKDLWMWHLYTTGDARLRLTAPGEWELTANEDIADD